MSEKDETMSVRAMEMVRELTSVAELKAVQEACEDRIQVVEEAERQALAAKFQAMAAEAGVPLAKVMELVVPRRPRGRPRLKAPSDRTKQAANEEK